MSLGNDYWYHREYRQRVKEALARAEQERLAEQAVGPRVRRRARRLTLETSLIVKAPAELVRDTYADYEGWPDVFPTISAVRLLDRRGSTLVLQVDHVEGTVINELTRNPQGELQLREFKRHYEALFVNRFDPIPVGTRFTVYGELTFNGVARHIATLLGPYARRQMRRLQLDPVGSRAEARAATSRPNHEPVRSRTSEPAQRPRT